MSTIPFEQIQAAALHQADQLLADWFPHGRKIGHEFKIGNIRGDAGESLSISLLNGKWADFASECSGHDLIDLLAAMRHRGDRVAAAHELADALGIATNGQTKPNGKAQAPSKPSNDWQSIIPPPPGTPRPPDSVFAGFDVTYDYTDAQDRVTHYVGRIEARGDRRKIFIPIAFGILNGVRGWHRNAPDAPRPLYGLNRLATMPSATVILCEGEKAADAAQALFPDRACLSWFGGTAQVEHADFTPLRGRTVIVWPDNDGPGHKAAEKVAAALPRARMLRVDDLAVGDDAADVHHDDPEAWLAARLPPLPPSYDAEWWLTRQLEKPTSLLGEVITDTTRFLLGGPTGIGKTHLALAMAAGIATGIGFCRWRSPATGRPVLYVDGEMARDLIQERLADLKRRMGGADLSNLIVICREDFPAMEALNTEAGQQFILDLAKAHCIAASFFDNRMCLVAGDMKEELPWTDTMPLIRELTRERVAQVWIDHAGHDAGKIYGTKTKEWQMDAVALLTEAKRPGTDVSFQLEFTKARRRRPETRQDFETVTLAVEKDQWTAEPTNGDRKLGKLPPARLPFYEALVAAIGKSSAGEGKTTLETWEFQCLRRGLIERPPSDGPDETGKQRSERYRNFRKAKSDLLSASWIAIEDGLVIDLKGRWA